MPKPTDAASDLCSKQHEQSEKASQKVEAQPMAWSGTDTAIGDGQQRLLSAN
jgi:hypothetical protein